MYFTSEGSTGQLYGTIWGGDGQYIASELKAFLKSKTEATIHLHTPGGSVFDGNLIYNALRNSQAKIHIVIDGLAASMGSILMLAGNTVSIADNAFVMIHAPSGIVEGNASSMSKAAQLLTTMEKQFITKYAAKTGKTEEEVKAWLNGDNWFSAEEALNAGLVDQISDTVLDDIDLAALQSMSFTALANTFDQKFIKQPSNNQNDEHMKLSAKAKSILGVADDATDEQVNEAVERLSKENDDLKEKTAAATKARIRALIDPAVADGRIPKAESDDWEQLATANYDLAARRIAALQAKENLPVTPGANKGNPVSEENKDWSFTDWSRKDTAGLLKMKEEDPDRYKALAQKTGIKL
ncbi:MAG: ATP-dependent Clp protease proteolytic subunit [Flavobacteriia bacterium]|nr:ATP-dependent Clp protease proteolytic subunit [Flavobacteriia bacterium]OJX36653.1 MAG: hypothetical protein BGO87_12710 [Flavobacteriia bacterium 40-80]